VLLIERSTTRYVLYGRTDDRLRATWRVVLSFVVFLGTLVAVSRALRRLPFPEVVINASTTLAVFLAVAVLLFVGTRFIERRSLAGYGLAFDRQWWTDAGGGVVVGFVFQGLFTALLLAFGSARLLGTLSPGVGRDAVTVSVAFGATLCAMVAVALWEELLFRGVLIQNTLEGLAARGIERRTAVAVALGGSALVFGLPHVTAVARGASAVFAVVQAVVAGFYFGLAYVLTESLGFPVGLHFSTNLWVVSVFGQPDSAFPALLRLERDLQAGPEPIVAGLLSTAVLVALVIGWVRFTRNELSIADSLLLPPRRAPSETATD
jgi:membrane protease YdiL (CAAX protease family)